MTEKTKTTQIAGGLEMVIRKPSLSRDMDRLVAFYSSLPPVVRNYLRCDATDRSVCMRRILEVDNKNHWRLIGEIDGNIVADATLDREPFGWTRHVAHLRVVLDPRFQKMGIKIALFIELVERGGEAGVERFYVEVLKEQKDLIAGLEGVGFTCEGMRKGFAKDAKGKVHDVMVFSNDRGVIWAELAAQMEDLDTRLSQYRRGA
jgi:RimJ/RimL family protein N-acetyltransferase